MKKEPGNVGDFMAVCICMLLMTVLLVAYMDSVELLEEKTEVNQIARKYILRMETIGYLSDTDNVRLYRELEEAGVTEVSLDGSTLEHVGYGEAIVLRIRGKLRGSYEIDEKRVSTAKY